MLFGTSIFSHQKSTAEGSFEHWSCFSIQGHSTVHSQKSQFWNNVGNFQNNINAANLFHFGSGLISLFHVCFFKVHILECHKLSWFCRVPEICHMCVEQPFYLSHTRMQRLGWWKNNPRGLSLEEELVIFFTDYFLSGFPS